MTTTITDDDAATGITLSADPDTLEEDQETAETVTVTATLNGGTRTEATVVTIGTLAGSATKDTDYTVTTALASITIPANSTSGTGTITITPIDDKVVEGNETITIPGSTTVEGLTVTSATITMKDLNGTTTDDPNDEDKADLKTHWARQGTVLRGERCHLHGDAVRGSGVAGTGGVVCASWDGRC